MVYLLTRPIVWLFKALKALVKLPHRAVSSMRQRRTRKQMKQAARAAGGS